VMIRIQEQRRYKKTVKKHLDHGSDVDQLLTEMDPAQGAAATQERGGARNPRREKKLMFICVNQTSPRVIAEINHLSLMKPKWVAI
jgi:hypothetical protein